MVDLKGYLLPQFELLTTPGIETMELAVWFWLVMIVIMVLSVSAVLYHRHRFLRRLTRVRRLIKGQDRNSLAQNRAVTLEKALKEDPKVTGALWREFDESLVYSSDKTQLSNTLDAEHFFNSHTLAYGLTSSRLLAAAPTFLTAIGVLGTFIGLTLGLKDLQINAEEIEALKTGISAMINGAAVAFVTSVWGVGLSLLLNMFEKIVERGALSKIRDLQQQIDFLYPRLPAEYSLVQIATATEESKEALQELHERIGDRLQEAVAGVTESMQQAFTDALNNVMAPAIEKMGDKASQQSTEVLEKLVIRFMEGMESTGKEQGKMMNGAASNVQSAVTNMVSKLELLFERLDNQQEKASQISDSMSQALVSVLKKHNIAADLRQQDMETKLNQMQKQSDQFINQLIVKLGEVSKSVETSSQHMNTSSTQLGLLSNNLKKSVDLLDIRLKNVTESLKDSADQNKDLASQIIQQAESLKSLQEELLKATESFKETAIKAESGFQSMTAHQQVFLQEIHKEFNSLGEELKRQVLEIEKQAEIWFKNYSKEVHTQVSDRMEQWNDTTLQFADQMRRTVSAISGIVDDLEHRR